MPIDQFMANENAAATNNKYTNMYTGKVSFKGTINGVTDEYERAQLIFDNILDLNNNSACIDKGESQYAPTIDILGRTRVGKPDIGAYEYTGKDNGNNKDGHDNGKHNGDINGKHNGDINGKHNGDVNGKHNGDINGKHNGKGAYTGSEQQ